MASDRPPCMWRGCRKRARFAMLLIRIDDDGCADVGTAEPVELCEECTRRMGYDASFPRKDDA